KGRNTAGNVLADRSDPSDIRGMAEVTSFSKPDELKRVTLRPVKISRMRSLPIHQSGQVYSRNAAAARQSASLFCAYVSLENSSRQIRPGSAAEESGDCTSNR